MATYSFAWVGVPLLFIAFLLVIESFGASFPLSLTLLIWGFILGLIGGGLMALGYYLHDNLVAREKHS